MNGRSCQRLFLVALLSASWGVAAQASVIIAPVSATVTVNGPGETDIGLTFDQSGLSIGYVSGITDFDQYLALDPPPLHSWQDQHDWFAEPGTSTATVIYDLGSDFTIDRLALWNEDRSGIGRLDLAASLDQITWISLATALGPPNNTFQQDYVAEVFSFVATAARYVRFQMSESPQPGPSQFPAVGIGEVAFRVAPQQVAAVPEPATLAIWGLGLVALTAASRRRRPQA